MQAAQLRLYQGRFFLIPESEVEAFDNCRTILETTSSTSEMGKAQLQYAERFLSYEIQKIDAERLQIEQQANVDAINKAYNVYETALRYAQGTKITGR
jgi:hypothetical protein